MRPDEHCLTWRESFETRLRRISRHSDGVNTLTTLGLIGIAASSANSAIDECNAVGADLVDLEQGVVRLGAEIEGRTVDLTWRLGEPIAGAWREDRGQGRDD